MNNKDYEKIKLIEELKGARNEMLTTNQLSIVGASTIFNALIYIIENTPANKVFKGRVK